MSTREDEPPPADRSWYTSAWQPAARASDDVPRSSPPPPPPVPPISPPPAPPISPPPAPPAPPYPPRLHSWAPSPSTPSPSTPYPPPGSSAPYPPPPYPPRYQPSYPPGAPPGPPPAYGTSYPPAYPSAYPPHPPAYAGTVTYPAGPYGTPPRRRGNGAFVLATVLVWALVMVGIVVGVGALADRGRPPVAVADPSERVRIADPGSLPPPLSLDAGSPSPGFEEAGDRLAPVVDPAAEDDSYAFLQTQRVGDERVPVAWSPCRPVHVALNPDGAPDRFEDVLLDALGELSAATGLVFVYDGETDEPPDDDRAAYQPGRYGDRWAPVLVGWTDDDGLTDFAGDVVGVALSHTARDTRTGAQVRTTGLVLLDTDLQTYPRDPTGQAAYVSVLHHELGHLVGLDHVDDATQLMYPEDSGRLRSFQDGDRTGLAELGEGVCAPGV